MPLEKDASPPRRTSRAPSRLSARVAAQPYFSLEFFPPRTEEGTANLMRRVSAMCEQGPLYVDVTSAPRNRDLALRICADVLKSCSVEVMLHVTCADWTREELRSMLDQARRAGVRNIMCLRGDGEAQHRAFGTAAELVAFVRREFGMSLCIAVAGYPEGCAGKGRGSPEYAADIEALKAKVDAGGEFVVTQLFFDVELYFTYVQDCRRAGVAVPIVPGVMPIQLFKAFERTTQYLRTRVPADVLQALEPIKDDDAKVRSYGIELATRLCRRLVEGGAPGVHFFTLNLERSVARVVESLHGVVHSQRGKALPWRQTANERRAGEEVRPIYWGNRPTSYVNRTQDWDEFPNGRWGDASSPAYGELTGSHYYQATFGTPVERRQHWGQAPLTVADLAGVFVGFVEGTVPHLPWSETGLALEAGAIRDALVQLNRNGLFTINSQPRVNAASSLDVTFGWGPPNGYVYQKAYVEFFTCAGAAKAIAACIDQSYPSLSYMAANHAGVTLRNRPGQGAMAVTWGVFPGREIVQPTVADPDSFLAWKDEAFELWTQAWASVYADDSPSRELIWAVHDSFYLMHVVDDDYLHGDVWKVFSEPTVVEAARAGLALSGVL